MIRFISKLEHLWTERSRPRGSVLRSIGVVTILNILFLATCLYAASASQAKTLEAVRQAFTTGELVDQDYLKTDLRRGKNQYNDCVVLQLLINTRPSVIQKALAPAFYVSDESKPDVCRSLRRLADGEAPMNMFGDSYSRYWHGYVPLTSALLTFTDIGTARQLLRIFVIGALLALTAAAMSAGGATRTAGISVSVTGLLFWGLPYYGQGLGFAPGDAMVILGIVALVSLSWMPLNLSNLVVFSAAYGSLVAYFDFLTGPLPTGACLLFLFTYLARFDESRAAAATSAWRAAFTGLAFYTLGAILTVAIKQLLVLAVLGPNELSSFFENARLYTGLADVARLPATYVSAFFNLFKYVPLLTLYNIPGAVALLLCSALAWAGAAYLAVRQTSPAAKSLFLAHVMGAIGVALWVFLLPTHTAIHGFMARMLIVPLALGWSALQLLASSRRRPSASDGHCSIH
jgi:hypothetical protein